MKKSFNIILLIMIMTSPISINKSDDVLNDNNKLIKSINKEINILDMGADPTGKTNCSEILQRAVDSAGTGGIVYIPFGLYLLEHTVIINNKDKFKLICKGQILINLNEDAFRLLNSSWCTLDGINFITSDSAGTGIKITGNSRFNVFENILAHGLNNYLFEIDNGSSFGIPNRNVIKDIDTRYSKGLLKDIADDDAPHGNEISVYNIRGAARLDNFGNEDAIPAYIWFKNIHDIFLSNIEGEHKFTYLLLQGDCNAIINNIMISTYEGTTIKFEASNNRKINLINFSSSYMWGIPSTHKYYKPNYAMEVSGCYILNASDVIISNYDRAGICQKSTGNYFYSNFRFINNRSDIEFYSISPETTILNFNNISVDHTLKGQAVFFAADSVNLISMHLHLINGVFNIKNQKENSNCKVFDFHGGFIDSADCRIFP